MAKKAKKWYKKNEKSHCFLIKVTFAKKFEMCVCRTRFKNPFLQKKSFYSGFLKKAEEQKKVFLLLFCFLNNFRNS
jgi:hypothetical protein